MIMMAQIIWIWEDSHLDLRLVSKGCFVSFKSVWFEVPISSLFSRGGAEGKFESSCSKFSKQIGHVSAGYFPVVLAVSCSLCNFSKKFWASLFDFRALWAPLYQKKVNAVYTIPWCRYMESWMAEGVLLSMPNLEKLNSSFQRPCNEFMWKDTFILWASCIHSHNNCRIWTSQSSRSNLQSNIFLPAISA